MDLGLGLRMNAPTDRAAWWWAGLHLLFTLCLPLLLVVLVGCKQAKAKREDLGPEVSTDAIDTALAKAMQTTTLDSLTVNQYVDYSHTRRIENEETVTDLGRRRVDVIDRQDSSTEARFTMRIEETQVLSDGKGTRRTIVTEDSLSLRKTDTDAVPQALRVQSASAPVLSAEKLAAAVDGKAGTITFHHLQESDATIDPPPAIKMRADCGGLPSCQMHVHYIQFDMVLWEDGTNYQKISFDLAFSADSPYLPYGEDFAQLNGALIMDCRSTFIPLPARTVYVRDCYSLEDFKK
jgi:hypothetical protein